MCGGKRRAMQHDHSLTIGPLAFLDFLTFEHGCYGLNYRFNLHGTR